MKIQDIINHLTCPTCKSTLSFSEQSLSCQNNHLYPFLNGVAHILPDEFNVQLKSTSDIYGKLWTEDFDDFTNSKPTHWHYHEMQRVLSQKIVQGALGLEIGCGNGFDSHCMAQENPATNIIGIDVSTSIFFAQTYQKKRDNLFFLRASTTSLPFADNTFDFCYSYGVLHHLPNPFVGFEEMKRVLKPGAPFYLYLYEDHQGSVFKYYPLKLISWIRHLSTDLTPSQLKILCTLLSPFIIVSFSWPSKVLNYFNKTKRLASKMPFNFGKGLFSLKGDLYDRFGAPFEYRFSQNQLLNWYEKLSFENHFFTRLEKYAGWVTGAHKKSL
ncbi:MAG: methyltransferase domain-containing protein [Deltaproteobacteria bacterium]|nr:methyltransferase domain-containing protein [Deltaproteobacteria bacterium]